MARGMVSSRKRTAARLMVFRWRPLKEPLLPKVFALLFVGGGFAFLITSVRIQVKASAWVNLTFALFRFELRLAISTAFSSRSTAVTSAAPASAADTENPPL